MSPRTSTTLLSLGKPQGLGSPVSRTRKTKYVSAFALPKPPALMAQWHPKCACCLPRAAVGLAAVLSQWSPDRQALSLPRLGQSRPRVRPWGRPCADRVKARFPIPSLGREMGLF